jgi:hypothetical protein
MQRLPLTEGLFEGAVSFETGDGWIKPWRLPVGQLRLFTPDDALPPRGEKPAGVRLRFHSDSRRVALGVAPAGETRQFDLTIGGELVRSLALEAGAEQVVFDGLPAGGNLIEVWVEHRLPIALRWLGIEDGRVLAEVEDARPRWVTYGSSITFCGEAHSPARTWPAIVARRCGLNLTCLGYGGNCHIEPMVAMMIRDLPADFISLKIGINIVGGSLSPRTFQPGVIGFVRIIRDGHPEVPIALISPIISPPRERRPGQTGLTLTMVREQVRDAVDRLRACGDGSIHYFDGRDLLGQDQAPDYLPDDLHPNADGYEVLARNFAEKVIPEIALPRGGP